jgi:hypothetical protein
MLRGQRDRLLQNYLDPPYGQRAAIRNARNGLAVVNGRAGYKLPGGNVPSVQATVPTPSSRDAEHRSTPYILGQRRDDELVKAEGKASRERDGRWGSPATAR